MIKNIRYTHPFLQRHAMGWAAAMGKARNAVNQMQGVSTFIRQAKFHYRWFVFNYYGSPED